MKKVITLCFVSLIFCSTIWAQKLITGVVTDANQEPLIGVNVVSEGKGTITDVQGRYTINVQNERSKIEYSFIGYKSTTVVVGPKSTINIVLVEDLQLLDEVVVTGYGTIKKGNMVSAYTSVSSSDIAKTVNTTIDQALQGRAAGVLITQNSGQPGGGMNINIRGLSSINGSSQPLYVIDGVEISGNNSTNGTNPLAGINPSDISNIDILQGPSATALYGSRGTDGVVLITTKRGEAGKTRTNYEFSFSNQMQPKFLETVPLDKFAELSNMVNDILGWPKNKWYADPSVLGKGTQWQNELFKQAITEKHQVALSGGNEKNKYYLSAENFNQNGVVVGTYFDRIALRSNLDNELYKGLKLYTNISFSQTKEDVSFSENDIVLKAIQMSPEVPIQNTDGTWGGASLGDPNGQFYIENPIALANLIQNQIKRTSVDGSIRLNYNVPSVKGLSISTSLVSGIGLNERYYFKPTYEMGAQSNKIAMSRREFASNTNWRWSQMLEYKRVFDNKHDLNVMFTHEASSGSYNRVMGESSGHLTNTVTELQDGDLLSYKVGSGRGVGPSMESYLGRINYSYDNRYIGSLAFRRDGTALFARNKRWASFPSAAFAWRASNEKFLKPGLESIGMNDLRFRFETGLTGKSMWGYQYLARLTSFKSEWGTSYFPANMENDDFQWESTMTYNYGIDIGLLKNRIQIIADVYQRYTNNMLGGLGTPWYMGLTTQDWSEIQLRSPIINNGSVENKGWGVQIKAAIIENKDFKWATTFNISQNKNKLNELTTKQTQFIQRQLGGHANNFTARSEVGNPLWLFYGYVSPGVYERLSDVQQDFNRISDPSVESNVKYGQYNTALPKGSNVGVSQSYAGDVSYVDFNNDGVIDEKDLRFIGNPWPDYTGGFINDFTYKSLSLSVLFTYSFGNDIYNLSAFRMTRPGESAIGRGMLAEAANWASLTNVDGDVVVSNPTTRVPRIAPTSNHGNYSRLTNLWVEDGSFIKCKNIQLSYNVPSDLLQRTKIIRTAKAYASAQNLFTITKYKGYDPEIGSYTQRNSEAGATPVGVDLGRYPQTRTYTVGLQLGF